MPFAARSLPLLAPQNDAAPSGGAKKKNKKKKSAAAKASAAQAAATSPTEASAPAPAPASTDEPEPGTETQNGAADHTYDGDVKDEPSADDAPVEDAPVKTDTDTDTAATATPASTETPSSPINQPATINGKANGHARNGSIANGHAIPLHPKTPTEDSSDKDAATAAATADRNGDRAPESSSPPTPTITTAAMTTQDSDDSEELRAQVERLRRQVEDLQKAQEAHDEETEKLKADLEESEAGREEAEEQYEALKGRVEKIKETLGSRFQRDKQELEECRERIEDLEAQNESLLQGKADAEAATAAAANEIARLQRDLDVIENEHDREHNEIRNRTQLSQQNWHREKQELMRQLESVQEELESTRNSMSDWEVVALEERNKLMVAESKVSDLEEQLQMLREQYQHAAADRDTQEDAVDGLQRSLDELQTARRNELREMVQESETKLAAAEARADKAEKAAEEAEAQTEELKKKVEKFSTMEAELKEKTSALGKLRHETIGMHEHLVRALRFIRKMKPDEAVEKQVMTNLLIQFLQIDRSDPKKFQVLQVIAGMLNWNDEEREKAGLARPGTSSSSSLRLPLSPFGRTPSATGLNAEFMLEASGAGPAPTSKSLSKMFKEFLEEGAGETHTPGPADEPLLAALLSSKPLHSRPPLTEAKRSHSKSPEAKTAETATAEATPSEEKPDKV